MLGAPVGGVECRIEEELKTASNSVEDAGEAPGVGQSAGARRTNGEAVDIVAARDREALVRDVAGAVASRVASAACSSACTCGANG